MDDGFLSPRPFHGKADEDRKVFLEHFQKWILFKNYSERYTSNAFPL